MFRDKRFTCAPYGAFELKATYQRNMMIGLLTAIVLAGAIAATLVIISGNQPDIVTVPLGDDDVIEIYSDPTQFSVLRDRSMVGGNRRPEVMSYGDIPNPMPDEEFDVMQEENVIMSTADRWAVVEGGRPGTGENQTGGSGSGAYGMGDIEYRPPIDSFIAVEQQPELIHQVAPEYPRFAKEAGLEGTVVIKALIGRTGDVLDAVVYATSGHRLLDEAALAVAGKYKYRPAIQNGRPIAIWVAYKVSFALE